LPALARHHYCQFTFFGFAKQIYNFCSLAQIKVRRERFSIFKALVYVANIQKMQDQESRVQEALLPIGSNAVAADQQRHGRTQVTTTQYREQYTSAAGRHGGDDSWEKTKKCCWWTTVILVVVLIFLIVSLKLFFFKPISNDVPKIDNSTAIEPNTKTRFHLLMEAPHGKVQSLVGASVWTYKIPIPTHPQIALAAVGYYLERAEGKRRLNKFKGKPIDEENFEDVEAVLVKPGMTESLHYVMATTPPSGRMLEQFADDTKPIMQELCPARVDEEFEAFSNFFPDPFKKGDDYTFEWRDGSDLYGYRHDERPKAKRVAGSCMATALFQSQLEAQKQALVNLIEDFFER